MFFFDAASAGQAYALRCWLPLNRWFAGWKKHHTCGTLMAGCLWKDPLRSMKWEKFLVPVAHGTLRMGDHGTLNPVMVLIYSCPLQGCNPLIIRIQASRGSQQAYRLCLRRQIGSIRIYPIESERDRHHIIARSVFSRAARQLVVNKNPSRKVPGGFGKLFSFGHSERKESQFLSKS